MDRIVQVTCLGKCGRFGNQLFQYAFARGYAERHGAILETPPWIGQKLFDLKDPRPSRKLPRTKFDQAPKEGRVNVDLLGSFNFNGDLQRQTWTIEQVRNWFRFRPEIVKRFVPPAKGYAAVHLRHGDLKNYLWQTCVIRKTAYVRALGHYGFDPDEAVWVCEEARRPIVEDFLTLMTAEALFLSNSTFSYWAGLLSDARCFSPVCEGLTGWVDCDFVEGHRFIRKWSRPPPWARKKKRKAGHKRGNAIKPVAPASALPANVLSVPAGDEIPIAVVTRNRAIYLDVTLRSLSATSIPAHVPLFVFDDASDDPVSQKYLYSDQVIPTRHVWPTDERWRKLGLDCLQDDPTLNGIANKVEVVKSASAQQGVGVTSCSAARYLFERFPTASGILLLQDDVIFNFNWYGRIVNEAQRLIALKRPIGILSGLCLGGRRNLSIWGSRVVPFTTAQCWFIFRDFFNTQQEWFYRAEHPRQEFDLNLCRLAYRSKFRVRLMNRFVGQHIGVDSLVRPEWSFFERQHGRFAMGARPPYALAEGVRSWTRSLRALDEVGA